MNELFLASISALWMGILTSISPCPLATNIAAIMYVGKQIDRPGRALMSGILYAAGRVIAYLCLALMVAASIVSASSLSMTLQKHMNRVTGPVLIVVGMFVLEIIRLKATGPAISERISRKVSNWGIWGSGALGLLFALAFCPVSAALFFGALIPLSIEFRSSVLLPLLYGIGTGIPVMGFAFLIAFGARYVGAAFDKLTQFEKWARRITGIGFIGVGIYLSLKYSFCLF